MGKRIKYNNVKIHRSYTLKEISDCCKVNIKTVQRWKKQGMEVIDNNSKPFLVEGSVLKEFLRQKRNEHKCTLNEGEFYCTKCKVGRKSLLDKVEFNFTGKQIGKNHKQVIIRGNCEVCGSKLTLFSTEKKAKDLMNRSVFGNG